MADVKKIARSAIEAVTVPPAFVAGAALGGVIGFALGPIMVGIFLAHLALEKVDKTNMKRQEGFEISVKVGCTFGSLAFIVGFLGGIIASPILALGGMYLFGKDAANFVTNSIDSVECLGPANGGRSRCSYNEKNPNNFPVQPTPPIAVK